jgi:DNA-binding NtrC family response regulator
MHDFTAVEAVCPSVKPVALLELSAFDRVCISRLVGHTIARLERELILQTLKCAQGNRTRSANLPGISVRSLRDKIKHYKTAGHTVSDPQAALRRTSQI